MEEKGMPTMKIKQINEKWRPRWGWFKPPKWFIFRWAYSIEQIATFLDSESNTEMQASIGFINAMNRNKRTYPADILMKQVSKGSAEQVQIGVVNNFYGEKEEE